MAKTLEQILGYENLIGVLNDPAGGVPTDIIDPRFLSLTRQVVGNMAKWDISPSTRRTAATTNYGTPARQSTKTSIGSRSAKCIHAFNMEPHDAATLTMLRQFDSPDVQTRGQQLIDAQTANFRLKLNNLRVSSVYSALRYGEIYLDGNGELLPSASSAVQTVDLQVPAANKGNLGGLVTADWNVASTDIPGNISGIVSAGRKGSGTAIRHAYYGKAIPSYFAANNYYKELLRADAVLATSLRSGTIPKGFGNQQIEWHPINDAFFEDSTGVNRDWFPDDFVVFTPEPSKDWYEMIEGSYEVPTTLGEVGGDANALVSAFKTTHGMFSFAKIDHNPSGIHHFMGDTFLPVFKVPNAVWIANTVA